MMKRILDYRTCVGLVCFIAITAIPALAVPPKVITTTPENGQQEVAPTLKQIRIRFNQDMNREGCSITGGRPTFPKTTGEPRWINKRTIVMPVRLKPNHEYELSVNSRSYKNFKNLRGESAVVYPIKFRTGPGGQKSRVPITTDNREAIKELRRVIEEDYSYYNVRGIRWDELFGRYEKAMKQAKTSREFAAAAAELLAHARDVHIWVKAGDQTVGGFRRNVRRNYNRKALAELVPNWQKRSAAVYKGRFDDGIGYILINSWSSQFKEALRQAYVAIWEFADAPGLIIDVRPNGGGAEPLAREVAGCFVDRPTLYAKHVYRSVDEPGGFGKTHKRILQPSKARPRYRGKIAVLMGPINMSSCEAFLLMMKQVPGCKLIGQKSYGSSGNPKPYELGNGVTAYLPSWKAMRPDGTCFEGEGIKPDIVVKTPVTNLPDSDPVLEAALKSLRKPQR